MHHARGEGFARGVHIAQGPADLIDALEIRRKRVEVEDDAPGGLDGHEQPVHSGGVVDGHKDNVAAQKARGGEGPAKLSEVVVSPPVLARELRKEQGVEQRDARRRSSRRARDAPARIGKDAVGRRGKLHHLGDRNRRMEEALGTPRQRPCAAAAAAARAAGTRAAGARPARAAAARAAAAAGAAAAARATAAAVSSYGCTENMSARSTAPGRA